MGVLDVMTDDGANEMMIMINFLRMLWSCIRNNISLILFLSLLL